MFDYLSETTISLLATARRKDPALGYATDFVDFAMRAVLKDALARGIRIIANAGGVNPRAYYKVTATYADGYRSNAQLTIVGFDAERKARRTAEAILERTREQFERAGLADYSSTHVEVEGIAAFVVLRPGADCDGEALRQHCRAHLARFEAPKHVGLLEKLPTTSTGKIQKHVLRGAHQQLFSSPVKVSGPATRKDCLG